MKGKQYMEYLCFEKNQKQCYLVYGVKPPREITETMDVIEVEEIPQKEGHDVTIFRDDENNIHYEYEEVIIKEDVMAERILQLEMAISDMMGMDI